MGGSVLLRVVYEALRWRSTTADSSMTTAHKRVCLLHLCLNATDNKHMPACCSRQQRRPTQHEAAAAAAPSQAPLTVYCLPPPRPPALMLFLSSSYTM